MIDIQEHLKSARRTGEIEFFIEERKEDCVVSRMPVAAGVLNPFGTVQAGAMLWLADVTATVLAIGNTRLGEKGQGFPLAINLNANLLGNQRGGDIRAEARFVRRGKRVTVVRTRVTGENDRLLALPEIAAGYETFKQEAEGTIEVVVTTAQALTTEQNNNIVNSMKKRLGKEVTITSRIDESLIAGAIIKAGDLVIDGTARGQLDKLTSLLNK